NNATDLSSDGLSLFLFSWEEKELYVSTRPTRDDLWSEPVNLGPTVNGDSTWVNRDPSISADGLVLIFASHRPGRIGGTDLWMTRRSTIDAPWSEPVNLGPTINSDWWEYRPEISADGRTLLFCSNRDDGHGDYDIWQASIDPVVASMPTALSILPTWSSWLTIGVQIIHSATSARHLSVTALSMLRT
ncbi:MAG: TolB family protein, partial [Planctomycetota bacterium]